MSHASMFTIPTPGGLAERYVYKTLPQTVLAGGVLQVPHLMSISPGNQALPPFHTLMVNVHLKTNLHAFNPLDVTAVDDVMVEITNRDGVNNADFELWVALLPPWLGLDGAGGLPRNWYTNGGLGYVPGPGAFGPAQLSDFMGAPPPFLDPLLVGHVNSSVVANTGDWIRYDDPPFVDAMGFTNDGAGGQDVVPFGATCHSVQRVQAPGGPSGLFSVIGPIGPINGGGNAVVPHDLNINGFNVIPDLAWTVPVGGNGSGVALVASNYQTLTLADPVACTWANENAPGGFNTYYACFYRQWSGGRVQ